jgi:hypothetical protein
MDTPQKKNRKWFMGEAPQMRWKKSQKMKQTPATPIG